MSDRTVVSVPSALETLQDVQDGSIRGQDPTPSGLCKVHCTDIGQGETLLIPAQPNNGFMGIASHISDFGGNPLIIDVFMSSIESVRRLDLSF